MQDLSALCPLDNVEWRARFIGVNQLGQAYFWRPDRELVRFPYVDPRRDPEGFAYNVLCENIAFDSESQLEPPYFPSHGVAAIHIGLLDTYDKLEAAVTRHCKFVFNSATLQPDEVRLPPPCLSPSCCLVSIAFLSWCLSLVSGWPRPDDPLLALFPLAVPLT